LGVHATAGRNPSSVTLLDVFRARRRIAPYLRRTPLIRSAWLSDLAGAQVSLKLESLQRSNSFKARGAFNAVIARMERETGPPAPRQSAWKSLKMRLTSTHSSSRSAVAV